MKLSPQKTARNNRIAELRAAGMSLNEIVRQLAAEGFGEISPQRVQRIAAKQVKA